MGAYIELKNITKTFGSVVANDGINFSIEKGEIHALLGENGSGKSTLVNMLSGIYRPDSGSILIDGKEVVFRSPKDAIDVGIGMVHQHFKLVDVMTARENIVMGHRDSFFVRKKKQTDAIYEIQQKYGLLINPEKPVYQMSVSEKQTVEILKVLYRGINILILDEPTAVLTPQEISNLFDILRSMRDSGCSIVIITHKMQEVMDISDRITVLRKGQSIRTVNTKDVSAQDLTEMMVGHRINLDIQRPQTDPALIRPLLNVKNLSVKNVNGTPVLQDMNFELHAG
ncbi:MAG: ATP-binding cassette domain-containing protein, partial [Clostridia bacterium]|nr:ATP-binding cassette domain-containing protein [Clostridia bacterium]